MCFALKIYADMFIDSYTGKVAEFAERFAHIYNREICADMYKIFKNLGKRWHVFLILKVSVLKNW